VTNQGKARWMIIDEAFNSEQLIEFLEALTMDACKKVLLIMDNLRLHHSEPVKAWLAVRVDRVELFNLPSYSPELNLEGQLNVDLKQAMGRRVPVRPKAKLRDAANDHMVTLERSPKRVRSFFLDQKVKYAALNIIGLDQ
jgi:transposase